MTYPMLDSLHILSEVLTAGTVVLAFGSIVICYTLLAWSVTQKFSLAPA